MNLFITLVCLAIAPAGDDAIQDVLILGETRPILVRFRLNVGDRPFRSAWAESTRKLHARLDRDKDGKLTPEEAEAGGLALLIAPSRVEADVSPKDGAISVDELAEAIRSASGPFRVQVDGAEGRRTDALFDHIDRDKDGQITRAELAAVVGTLRRLDRDDDELIGIDEVAGLGVSATPPMMTMTSRPARDLAAPAAVALVAGESTTRLVRVLMKKYDTGSSRGPGKTDSRLSPEEFAIPAAEFTALDASGDGSINAEELRGYLAKTRPDAVLDVVFSADATGHASARLEGSAEGFSARSLAEGVVELEFGPIRLDIHVDDGASMAESARRTLRARFDAADANQDGYLEPSELTQDDGQPSPLAGLFRPLDRDGDGKVYPVEIDEFVSAQAEAARGRLTLTASDEGRALFGLLDLDSDRRLGAREVLDTFARLAACDRDGDGRIAPEEIPHHVRLTLSRGDLSALLAPPAVNPANAVAVAAPPRLNPTPRRPAAGPPWFRKMDRNGDGDVSRREFLGTIEQFDRLDRDRDGLLSPIEAEAARPVAVKGPGG